MVTKKTVEYKVATSALNDEKKSLERLNALADRIKKAKEGHRIGPTSYHY